MNAIDFIGKIFYEIFFKLIIPLFLIVFLLIIIEVIYNYIKYGKTVFSVFKKKEKIDARDKILYLSLNKINGYKKILKLNSINSNYIVINKSGISLYYLFLYQGNISKSNNNSNLILEYNYDKEVIENPIKKLDEDEKTIKKHIDNMNITKYLVILDDEYINFKTDVKIISFNKLIYQIKENNLYTNDIIDNVYKELIKKCQ